MLVEDLKALFLDKKNQDFLLFVKSNRPSVNWSGHCISFQEVEKIVNEVDAREFPFIII